MDTKRNQRTSFILFIFLMFILWLTFVFTSKMNRKEYTRKEFINELQQGSIERVLIEQDRTVPNGSARIIFKDGLQSEYIYNVSNVNTLAMELNAMEIDYTMSEAPGDNIFLSYAVPIILFLQGIVIIMIILQLRAGAGVGANKGLDFGKSRATISKKTNISFGDVAGLNEEKEELEEIVDFLKNHEKYTNLGARIPKGIILVGPPGTGKTLLAKAVAGEANVPFFSISGSDFVEMFVGVGASRVRDLFNEAKRNAPCIIFIDEIDAVARRRGSGLGGSHDEREQTLNQMLVEMDGFGVNEGIIVLAATNRVDILDPAILRPGRFDRKIAVGRPDVRGREDILKVHSRNKKLAEDVDLQKIAKNTPGFTGADLENIMNEAAIIAAKESKEYINQLNIENAFIKVGIGTEKKSRIIPEKERKITAYHEAGHAILFRELEDVGPVHTISIIPTGMGAAGYTMPVPKDDNVFETRNRMLHQIMVSLGGRIAEEIVFGDVTTGASQDIKQVTSLAKAMVTKYGMSEKLGMINYESDDEVLVNRDFTHTKSYSDETAASIDKEIRIIVDDCYKKAKDIILSKRDILDKSAALLLEKEKIGFEEFEALFEA